MSLVFYISHPQVEIDPDILVPDWHLSDVGRKRLATIADAPWIASLAGLFSSIEPKAIETAQALSLDGRTPIETDAQMSEIDRSSTGYVSHERHEELANALFADPQRSAQGWERALDAQRRVCDAVESVLAARTEPGNIAFVGHGGVGTLLACKLAGLEIARKHDQPGGGHVFAFDRQSQQMLFTWVALEEVEAHLETL